MDALTFAPVSFADLPGWTADDQAAALEAFKTSCATLKGSTTATGLTRRWIEAPAFANTCAAASAVAPAAQAARAFFETTFRPFRPIHSGPPGLLTGYYEPELQGSRTPSSAFPVAIYRRPPDLLNVLAEADRATAPGVLTHERRTEAGALVPYFTRREIEEGALAGKGLELLYVADRVEAFMMQVQGSGLIAMTDGSKVKLAYDGKNGRPYTSIGRSLIDEGIIGADKMTLEALSDWLKADAERGRAVMWRNESFVFFRELTGPDAGKTFGALDIPLTPGRSLAVDAGRHALGLPIFVNAPTLTHAPGATNGFRRLMIAQDVGAAIRGPERGDIFFGHGPEAGALAGQTKSAGEFFLLLPNDLDPGLLRGSPAP